MQDERIMQYFRASPDRHKAVFGGLAPDGQVNCYWGSPELLSNPALERCKADGNVECKLLADKHYYYYNMGFSPQSMAFYLSPQTPKREMSTRKANVSSADGLNADVIWYLIGSFASGMAQGYAESSARAATTGYIEVPSRSARQPQPQLRCTPMPMSLTMAGIPAYQCR
jgi:hypothetical protein